MITVKRYNHGTAVAHTKFLERSLDRFVLNELVAAKAVQRVGVVPQKGRRARESWGRVTSERKLTCPGFICLVPGRCPCDKGIVLSIDK
jgi:hypothetical protein